VYPGSCRVLFHFCHGDWLRRSNPVCRRYLPIGISGSASLLAVDASGNFFIVATVQEPSGRSQIRAIKTDGQGNELASLDFGSGSDVPAGAAVDPQGDLVIVGTTMRRVFQLSRCRY